MNARMRIARTAFAPSAGVIDSAKKCPATTAMHGGERSVRRASSAARNPARPESRQAAGSDHGRGDQKVHEADTREEAGDGADEHDDADTHGAAEAGSCGAKEGGGGPSADARKEASDGSKASHVAQADFGTQADRAR